MTDRAVWPIDDEIIRHVGSMDSEEGLRVIPPRFESLSPITLHLPLRNIAHIEPSSADDGIEFTLFPVLRYDTLLGDLCDGTPSVAAVLLLQGFQIPLAWGEPSAPNTPLWNKLLCKPLIATQALLHYLGVLRRHILVLGRVGDECVEKFIEGMLNVLAIFGQ